MNTVHATVSINAPRENVWPAIADFGQIVNFNPNVKESHLTGDQTTGAGATRHCSLNAAGASIEERIIEWQDGESYTVEIFDSSRVPVVIDMVASIVLADEDGGTRATMTMDYDTKYGPLGALLDRVAIKGQNAKAVGLVMAGLKHYVETGEKVDAGIRVDTSAVT